MEKLTKKEEETLKKLTEKRKKSTSMRKIFGRKLMHGRMKF